MLKALKLFKCWSLYTGIKFSKPFVPPALFNFNKNFSRHGAYVQLGQPRYRQEDRYLQGR